MAEVYEVEVNGQVYEVEADHPQQAAMTARFLAARDQGTAQAEAGARARLGEPEAVDTSLPLELTGDAITDAAMAGIGYPSATTGEDAAKNLATAGAVMSAGAAVPGLVAAPVAAGKMLLGGLVGSAAGSEAGKWVGRSLPVVGGETAGNVLGTLGGLVGGVGGGAIAPKLGAGKLLQMATGGRGGVLNAILGSGEGQAATAAREAAAAETAALRNALLKTRTKALEQKMSDSMRRLAIAEAKEARLAKKAGISVPELRAATAPAPAPAAVQSQPTMPPQGQRTMPTNLGGPARPGPAPTRPEDLEETLRQSIEAAKAAQAARAATASPLKAPRIQVGAQRVGKQAGLTKEEVRRQTGPILGEAVGEASPILPQEPLKKIIDTMRALPKTGGAREAYVARATSGKAQWQIENIRRTLEHLGLLAPVAAVGAATEE